MSLQLPIGGILCDIDLDENEFFDVHIAQTEPEQKLLPQWIVRGEPDLDRALDLAEQIIELRLNGYSIMHHNPEGRIEYCKDPGVRLLRGGPNRPGKGARMAPGGRLSRWQGYYAAGTSERALLPQ